MADDNNKNQSLANEIATSAETAKNVAQAAAAAGKAVAKAASGNIAGAAVEVAKNKTLRNIVLGIIIIALVLPLLTLYAMPSMIFSAIEDAINELAPEDIEVMSMSGNSFIDLVLNVGYWTKTLVGMFTFDPWADLFSMIKSWFNEGEVGESDDTMSFGDEVFQTTWSEDAATSTLQTEVDYILARFDKRREQYENLLDDIQSSFQLFHPAVSCDYDEFYVTTTFKAPEITEREAAQYIAAYSTQRGNSTDTTDLKSVMSWIGYYNGLWKTDHYTVLSGYRFSTYDWHGDYMPQYRYEQMLQDEANGWTSDDYETDAFLDQVYYVDKETGIKVTARKYEIKVPKTDSFGAVLVDEEGVEMTEVKVIVVMNIAMSVTVKSANEIAEEVMGFWSGPLQDDGSTADPVQSTDPASQLSYCWIEDERIYTRQTGYQTEFFEDLFQTTAGFLGYDFASYYGLEYSSSGGEESTTENGERFVSIAESQIGHNGSSPYWTNTMYETSWQWYFVRWCAQQAGLRGSGMPFESVYGGLSSLWTDFGGYADTNNAIYRTGANSRGASIAVEDTTLLCRNRTKNAHNYYIPQRGDLVLFCSDDGKNVQHIGIVVSYNTSTNELVTVEGNVDRYYPHYNGTVALKYRTTTQQYGTGYKTYNIVGFIHPNFNGV